mmetsp:Transcript_9772/g.16131  ORF Transcript_9772/g.16131 Transcript_9772/m.16131 type:complete len:82 (+) Transcript_9772:311-556(+)
MLLTDPFFTGVVAGTSTSLGAGVPVLVFGDLLEVFNVLGVSGSTAALSDSDSGIAVRPVFNGDLVDEFVLDNFSDPDGTCS